MRSPLQHYINGRLLAATNCFHHVRSKLDITATACVYGLLIFSNDPTMQLANGETLHHQ